MNITDINLEIVGRKHDLGSRLRGDLYDPLEEMNNGKAAEEIYFKKEGKLNNKYLKLVPEVLDFFSHSWNDKSLPDDEQYEQLIARIKKVETDYLPLIEEVLDFYERCHSTFQYFTDSAAGRTAKDYMYESFEDKKSLIKEIKELLNVAKVAKNHVSSDSFNLLACLQNSLDRIEANVRYSSEVVTSSYESHVDKDAFVNHVLSNIKDNINTHAFGTELFRMKHVWEKNVLVSVTETDSCYRIVIENDGEPFTGNEGKLFSEGYCHGERKHSGYGLYSARKTMRELGGDIEFKKDSKTNLSATYIIKLPK